MIKGATALLARRVSVRHTIDLDVYRAGAIAETERLLREAAALDIGDWMTFEIGAAVQIHASGAQAARAKVETFIGVRLWSAFQGRPRRRGHRAHRSSRPGAPPDRH